MPSEDGGVEKLKVFLESTPPNTPAKIAGLIRTRSYQGLSSSERYLGAPELLELHCDEDGGVRRFRMQPRVTLDIGFRFLSYVCKDCGEFEKTYAMQVKGIGAGGIVEIMKLGEYPPFGAPISARIQKLLSKDDLELYRKGCRSETQGLGIGAATYFRRIVDRNWKLLVTRLRRAAKELGRADLAVFDKALKATQFKAAVKMLEDVIPDKLLVLNGKNPLTVLYSPLSVQLHQLTDEECLQQAADIRTVLTALLEQIADVLKDQEELKKAVNRLEIRRSE